jgi:hypothetical protein
VAPYASALRELSARRVAADRQLGYVEEDLRRLKTTLATKAVSLNEADRRQELADGKAREKQRDAADRSARTPLLMGYQITLRNAAAPGLPPPGPFLAAPGASLLATSETDASDTPPRRDDVILGEAVRILAEYVGLLTATR